MRQVTKTWTTLLATALGAMVGCATPEGRLAVESIGRGPARATALLPPQPERKLRAWVITPTNVPLKSVEVIASCPNRLGQIAFWDESSKAISLTSGGTVTEVLSAKEIRQAGVDGTVFWPALNASGHLAFVASSDRKGKPVAGVFLLARGTLKRPAMTGDRTPTGDTYGMFGLQALTNARDQVLFLGLFPP